jgi:riboflavin-specific deaminase-like protein
VVWRCGTPARLLADESRGRALRRLFPDPDSREISPDEVYRHLTFPSAANGRPHVAMNMVSTVDGKTALGASAAGIGSRTDARLMRQIRAAADAIIWGAGTLRADVVDPRVDPERVRQRLARGQAPQPLAVSVSGSLDLEPTNRFFVNGPARTILFTTASAPPERRRALEPYAIVVVQDGETVDLAAAMGYLGQQHGVRSLLSEGGPGLNQRLLDAGVLDELFWTVAPKLAGGHGRTLVDDDDPATAIRARIELISLFEHDGELYSRYRLLRGPDGAYAARHRRETGE